MTILLATLLAAAPKSEPLNGVLAFGIAVLIYPGLIVAVLAGWALSWARASARAVAGRQAIPAPLTEVHEIRAEIARDSITPPGIAPRVVGAFASIVAVFPLVALVLLPVPGNPLVASLGLQGDLVLEGGLLLGVPVTRLLLGWIIPSPYTRLAADRGARLLAGVVVTMALALAANAEQLTSLSIAFTPAKASLPTFALVTRLLAALAFAFTLPALARPSAVHDSGDLLLAGELTEMSGADLAGFRIAEAFQLLAAAGVFTAVFLLPLLPTAFGTGRSLLWLAGIVLTTLGIGAWEGYVARQPARQTEERPPLTWWLGWPVLIAMLSLVAAAWAARGA
ncbi:MAG TPA: NADH-quinone oxidoreductase subunit H [Ktedonobacterales bacterium]|nr:NADH-quinone oxidoreductase subunit H [Ktedonobacterales bacterium]